MGHTILQFAKEVIVSLLCSVILTLNVLNLSGHYGICNMLQWADTQLNNHKY